MICKNCGATLSAGSKFCIFCGATIEADPADDNTAFSSADQNAQDPPYTVVTGTADTTIPIPTAQQAQEASYTIASDPNDPTVTSSSTSPDLSLLSEQDEPQAATAVSTEPEKAKKARKNKLKKVNKQKKSDIPDLDTAPAQFSDNSSSGFPEVAADDSDDPHNEQVPTTESEQKQADHDAASKGTKPRTVGVIALIEVVVLAVAVFIFFQFRTDTIQSVTAEALSIDSISVTVESRNGKDLEVICSTDSGEIERVPVTDSTAVFTDLEPSTSYTFEPASSKGKLLLSNTTVSAKTEQETNLNGIAVTSYSATSATFSVSGSGPVPDSWLVTLTADDGTVTSETVTGTEFTFDELTPQTTYTVTVERGDGEPLSGANTCEFTTQGYTILSDFVQTSTNGDSISLAWSYSGTIPDSWTLSCSSSDGSSTETDVTGTEYTLTDLVPGNTYTITLSCSSMEATDADTISVLLLGENIFTDVADDSYCYEPVLWAYYSGITSGTGDTTFSPDQSCTRAQVVTFLWRLAGEPKPTSSTSTFTDVTDPASPSYDAIMWAVESGITSGTSDTTFSPDAVVTRAQVVTFLWRYAGKPEPETTDSMFTDVSNSDAMLKPIMWAVENGISAGTSDTTFSPDQSCSRGQVVTFMYRYLGIG